MKNEDGIQEQDEDEHGFYDLEDREDWEAYESGRPFGESD